MLWSAPRATVRAFLRGSRAGGLVGARRWRDSERLAFGVRGRRARCAAGNVRFDIPFVQCKQAWDRDAFKGIWLVMRASKNWTAALMALVGGVPFEASAGAPHDWQTGFVLPASPNMASIVNFNDWLFWIIAAISAFVLALLVYAMVRFNEKSNPTPSRRSHNTLIEVIWTVVPIIILVGISIPSFKQLYYLGRTPAEIGLTLKATGKQWYWSYEYPDHPGVSFDAFMVPDDALQPGQLRLLETDNIVYVPVDTNVRVLLTADDVIHAWTVPAFGVKQDAVPGRTNELWFRATKPGSYYGQCSELCGINHGFMPIRVEVVSKEDFAKWVEEKKAAMNGDGAKLAQVAGQ